MATILKSKKHIQANSNKQKLFMRTFSEIEMNKSYNLYLCITLSLCKFIAQNLEKTSKYLHPSGVRRN